MGCGCSKTDARDIIVPNESAQTVLSPAESEPNVQTETTTDTAGHEFSAVANPEVAVETSQSNEDIDSISGQSEITQNQNHGQRGRSTGKKLFTRLLS